MKPVKVPDWARRLAKRGHKTKYTHPEEYRRYLDAGLQELAQHEFAQNDNRLNDFARKEAAFSQGRDLVTIFKIGN